MLNNNSFRFSKSYQLQQHLVMHIDPDIHRCEVCQKSFSRKDSLLEHKLKYHIKKKLECTYCSFKTLENTLLTAHIKTHHEKVIKPKKIIKIEKSPIIIHSNGPQCEFCKIEFSSEHEFFKHLKRVHDS